MKKKNAVGALVMTGLILVSVPLGVNRSFSRMSEQVKEAYYYDQAGYAIYEGIDAREAAANNLITVAKRYTDQEPGLVSYIDELEYRVKRSDNLYESNDPTFEEIAKVNREIGEAAQALSDQLSQVQLSEKDAKYPGQIMAQMESEQDKIQRSSYNEEAIEYNAKLDQFPVNLLRHLVGIEPLHTFE